MQFFTVLRPEGIKDRLLRKRKIAQQGKRRHTERLLQKTLRPVGCGFANAGRMKSGRKNFRTIGNTVSPEAELKERRLRQIKSDVKSMF